jgi:hypothetical protein
MRARQQAQASQIFKAQQKQYEPAYLNQLDNYIVSQICINNLSCLHLFLEVPHNGKAPQTEGYSETVHQDISMPHVPATHVDHSVAPVPMQEELYEEDMQHKVHATGMIAQLFRQTENFETLLSHETLLQVCWGASQPEVGRGAGCRPCHCCMACLV